MMSKNKSIKEGKTVIYGTGSIAKTIIESNAHNVVGVLDRKRICGDFLGVPILDWDDISGMDISHIIIAADRRHVREIYYRIVYRCISYNIDIMAWWGENLNERYSFEALTSSEKEYFKKNKEDLKSVIEQYDIISFDLFDTLIMRNVYEPYDMFSILADKLKDKNINIDKFKCKRVCAEQTLNNGRIDEIYRVLGQRENLSEEEINTAINEEISLEKKILIKRTAMQEVFNYAKDLGKKIYIVSDMYLPEAVLGDILHSFGFYGYKKIYVSCEYGVNKGGGLYDKYKEDVSGHSFLHIGDNPLADGVEAEKVGIDFYNIKSAYELLKISDLRRVLIFANSIYDRILLGSIISELFNDPFALYGDGFVKIDDIGQLMTLTVLPIVISYMQSLYKMLDNNKYDGIAFGARDGYLFKKIFDKNIMNKTHGNVSSEYLLISRRVALKCSLCGDRELDEFINFYIENKEEAWKFASTFFDDELGDITWTNMPKEEVKRLVNTRKEYIYEDAKSKKNLYCSYLDQIGLTERFLFCELISSGTIHQALCRIIGESIDGFYLLRTERSISRDLPHVSVFESESELIELIVYLESVLTSFEPSIYDINQEGHFIYSDERRSHRELMILGQAQSTIYKRIKSLYKDYSSLEISPLLAAALLFTIRNVVLTGTAKEFVSECGWEDMKNEKSNIML